MKKLKILFPALFFTVVITAQQNNQAKLPFKMEEITSPQFPAAVEKAGGVCVIPLGVIEKHGPHLPLGTDMFEAREIAFRAAKLEYAIVFPPYYASQIFEGKHQPGTIAYSNELMWRMLEETCSELSRNGVKKIILDNGHGGNNNFLAYFCQSQLDKPHDYVVVLFQPRPGKEAAKKIEALKRSKLDGHAGEEETSMMNVIRPDLVNNAAAKDESGSDLARLKVPYGYTGIWWYARYPNHYAGDGSMYSRELGEMLLDTDAAQLAELIRFLKKDNSIKELQEQFYKKTMDPLLK